jgi:hypothetical protein
LINTVIPVLYWISRINSSEITLNLEFILFFIGIPLIAIQLYYENIFETLFNKKEVETERPKQVLFLKQHKAAFISSIVFWIYGLSTFYFMYTGPKSEVVWTLISAYLIGILIILFNVWRERSNLKNYGILFTKK